MLALEQTAGNKHRNCRTTYILIKKRVRDLLDRQAFHCDMAPLAKYITLTLSATANGCPNDALWDTPL